MVRIEVYGKGVPGVGIVPPNEKPHVKSAGGNLERKAESKQVRNTRTVPENAAVEVAVPSGEGDDHLDDRPDVRQHHENARQENVAEADEDERIEEVRHVTNFVLQCQSQIQRKSAKFVPSTNTQNANTNTD